MNKLWEVFAIVFILSALWTPADAGDVELVGLGFSRSHHTDRDADYNETHNMWGVEINDIQLVTYNNSNRNRGHILAYSPEFFLGNHLCAGYTVGLVSGYVDAHKEQAVPFAMPKLCAKWGPVQIDVHTIPTVIDWEIHASIKLGEVADFPSEPSTNFALGYGYGTMGPQYSVLYNFADDWDVRISGGKTDYEWDDFWIDELLIQTEKVQLGGYGLFVDYYPFGWHVGVYGGLMYNEFKYSTKYTESQWGSSVEVEGVRIPKDQFNYLGAEATWDSFSPSVGIRFGNPWRGNKRCSFYVDIGVIQVKGLSGKFDYDIPAVHGNPALKGQIDQELAKWVKHNIDKYEGHDKMPRAEAGFTCGL